MPQSFTTPLHAAPSVMPPQASCHPKRHACRGVGARGRIAAVPPISDLGAAGGRAGRLARPGDHSAREPPDPIPNSAVKPCCAQGTALLRVGERVVARPSEAFGSKRGRFKQASGSKRVQRGVRFGKDAAPRLRARTRFRGPSARPARGQARRPPGRSITGPPIASGGRPLPLTTRFPIRGPARSLGSRPRRRLLASGL
jgi:hypothetical protein